MPGLELKTCWSGAIHRLQCGQLTRLACMQLVSSIFLGYLVQLLKDVALDPLILHYCLNNEVGMLHALIRSVQHKTHQAGCKRLGVKLG